MKRLWPWSTLVALVIVLILILMGGTAHAQDQPQLTVEVLKAETVHWTTYLHTHGSSGTTTTDCDISSTGTSASCTSKTEGARPASDRPIYHTQVNLLVKMPDGNTISMQCHHPPIWATCFEPQLGTYNAKINGHNIHLLIPVVTGKPKYNKDGTIKKPAKAGVEEVKFSFQ